ncbi:hypothetical protein DFH09DRAFT_1276240 [Mycena vulgaris]|nr:hypothetical protein DFH09DRAFT_1276240 [Mycena vulgaris]
MWKMQDTLVNLFKCMPSDLWQETADREYVLDGDRESDAFDPCIRDNRSLPSLRLVVSKSQGDGLDTYTGRAVPYVRLLLSLKLRDIHLCLGHSKSAALPVVSHKCPALRFAARRYRDDFRDDDELRSVSLFICSLTQIETLKVNAIDRGTFKHIGHLPALRALKLGKLQHWDHQWHPAVLPRLLFPALHILHLEDTSAAEASAHIEMLAECELAHLTIDLTTPPPPASRATPVAGLFRAAGPEDGFYGGRRGRGRGRLGRGSIPNVNSTLSVPSPSSCGQKWVRNRA